MDLRPLFKPGTIAVFGVSSSNDLHPANEIFTKNLLLYPVKVCGGTPCDGSMNGQLIHWSVSEISEPIDLAMIAVRSCRISFPTASGSPNGGIKTRPAHDSASSSRLVSPIFSGEIQY
jgi:hypothetical protein